MPDDRTTIYLDESRVPLQRYNVVADLRRRTPPPLHPATNLPVGPDDLGPLSTHLAGGHDRSSRGFPPEVRDVYRRWRPRRCTAPGGWTRRGGAPTREEKVIVTALSGHGHFDMSADDRHPAGAMEDLALPRERIGTAPANLPAATS